MDICILYEIILYYIYIHCYTIYIYIFIYLFIIILLFSLFIAQSPGMRSFSPAPTVDEADKIPPAQSGLSSSGSANDKSGDAIEVHGENCLYGWVLAFFK